MIGLPLDDRPSRNHAVAIVLGVIALVVFFSSNAFGYLRIAVLLIDPSLCPVAEVRAPRSFGPDSVVFGILNDPNYRKWSVRKLSNAVKVDTQIFDNQPDVPDAPEVWAKFDKFHEYLENTFASVYDKLDVYKVNTYGLVFHWKGTDEDLKPILLTAHQDVVPVQSETLGDWTYPPFDGHYDGTYLYGRGSSDCKNLLVAILETLQLLIETNFVPKRGIIAAFGFDEEASGIRGAANIGKFLEDKFGRDSIHALLDEGPGLQIDDSIGQIVAAPGAGEKGYIDIEVSITTPGGHSSVPPDHTSIGIAGELAYLIEKDPYAPRLTDKNPMLGYLQCLAANSDKLPKLTRKAILRAGFDKLANLKVLKVLTANPFTRYLVQTSQAIDIIKGGEKANALPENVKTVVNHRIAVELTVDDIKHHFTERVLVLAKKHHLNVESFGETVFEVDDPKGKIVVSTPHALEVAPVSPYDDDVWNELAGVTRHVFEDVVFPNLTYPIISAPSIMPANTDTRHYWNLTRNIYRYSPALDNLSLTERHIHSVDEKVEFDSHLQLIAFFYEYAQVVSE